eukprot:6197160-Pleurochrysis_carterae.AAC.3
MQHSLISRAARAITRLIGKHIRSQNTFRLIMWTKRSQCKSYFDRHIDAEGDKSAFVLQDAMGYVSPGSANHFKQLAPCNHRLSDRSDACDMAECTEADIAVYTTLCNSSGKSHCQRGC